MALFLSVLFLLLGLPGDSPQEIRSSRHSLALSVSDQENRPSAEQLEIAREMGIRLFEIQSSEDAANLDDPDIRFLLNAGPQFSVPGTIPEQKSDITEQITSVVNGLSSDVAERVAAVSILYYPFEEHPDFTPAAAMLADTLNTLIAGRFYFHSAFPAQGELPSGYSFASRRTAPGQAHSPPWPVIHFAPSEDDHDAYIHLNRLIHDLQSSDEESITVLPANWFFDQIENNPDLRFQFSNFINGETSVFPVPEPTRSAPEMNWSVILLMVIWGSFAVHLRYQPIYSQSMIRYFSNHAFFVSDVMENRLRNIWPGLILLLQHSLLTGLFVFASVEVVVSSVGMDIIKHHFSGFILLEGTMPSLFIAGILTAVLLQFISVSWIFIANKKLLALSQILNLYSWPLHLNLVVVTFLIVFNRVGFDEIWIFILSSLFILIWFFSFNIAAIDSSKLLEDGRTLFLAGTVGLHVLVVIGVLVYILYNPAILEPILYAIEVP